MSRAELRVRIVRATEYTRYWHAIQPYSRHPLPSFLSFSSWRRRERAERESAQTDQKDIACCPIVPFAHASCHFFLSLFAFQLTLLFLSIFFLSIAYTIPRRGRCPRNYLSRPHFAVSGQTPSLVFAANSAKRWLYVDNLCFYNFSREDNMLLCIWEHDVLHMFEKEVCYRSERRVSRIHYARATFFSSFGVM